MTVPCPQEECRELLVARREELERQEEVGVDGERASNRSSTSIESIFLKLRILRKPQSSFDETHAKALVIDGETLRFALQPSLRQLFLDVAKRCRSVICCRAAPLQKVRVAGLTETCHSYMFNTLGASLRRMYPSWCLHSNIISSWEFIWGVVQSIIHVH